MPDFNRVILMGRLTRDPELRYTPSGQAVSDIRIAINRRGRSSDSGDRRDSTTFVDVTAWGRQAEVINEYLGKGQPIFLEGRLHLDEWTSQDGQRRSKLRVVLENFQFVTPRSASTSRGTGPADSAPRQRGRPAPEESAPEQDSHDEEAPFDNDVPF